MDASFHVDRCSACGFVFENPRPTIDSIIEFYSSRGKYSKWVDRTVPYERLWARRLKRLLPFARKGNLLDVGAGIGQFLSVAKPHFSEIYGTEVSSSGIEVAKQKYGITLCQGEVQKLDFPLNSFNNITLFHVLEHVPDPMLLLARCHDLLKDDGMLVVCVPNDVLALTSKVKALGSRLRLKAFRKFSPSTGLPFAGSSSEIHLSHFTPRTLTSALTRAGFDVIQVGLDPYYAWSGWRGLLEVTHYRLQSLLHKLTHVNRYDTIWSIAYKSKKN